MKVLQNQKIQVSSELVTLNQVLSWFEDFDHSFIPETVWLQCQLALAEGFTNAVRHGHRDKPTSTLIELEVTISDKYLEIRIWDSGPSNNLGDIIASLSQEMDKDSEGGRGLKLMKKVADVLHYSREADERNCLAIGKHYEISQAIAHYSEAEQRTSG